MRSRFLALTIMSCVTGAIAYPAKATWQSAVGEQGVVVGFGRNEPLQNALRKIVPVQMRVHIDPAVDPNMLVCWRGGRHWRSVIGVLGERYALNVIATEQMLVISKSYADLEVPQGCPVQGAEHSGRNSQ